MILCNTQRMDLPCGHNFIPGMIYWYDNDPEMNIFIPLEPIFSIIKNFVIEGSGLHDSYMKAGQMLYQIGYDKCNLESFIGYPKAVIDMPIKFYIYDARDYIEGASESRPYSSGEWIREAASKILGMYFAGALSKPGRLELQPGIILPTQTEGNCIKEKIRYSNMSVTEAFTTCGCSEILPVEYLDDIESIIRSSRYTMFYTYMIALTKDAIPPENPENEDGNKESFNKALLYGIAGFTAITLLSKE